MNKTYQSISSIFIILLLAACSTASQQPIIPISSIEIRPELVSKVNDDTPLDVLYTKEVAYRCGENQELMRVQYGFDDREVLVAQVYFRKRLTPILYKQPSKKLTKFENAGVTWVVEPLTVRNLSRANGKYLLQQEKVKSGKSFAWVNVLVIDKCLFDEKTSQRLNQK